MKNRALKSRILLASFFLLVLLSPSHARESARHSTVKHVIDGDTIVIDNGDHVRYIGMDAPEVNEPFYEEARARNKALVEGKRVKLAVCREEPRDKYGRLLAFVYADGVLVNEKLLKEGLAKTLIIPPCGLKKAKAFEKVEKEARDKRLGLWGNVKDKEKPVPVIQPEEALRHVGEAAKVKGTVTWIKKTKGGVFIDFGADPVHLRAVILKKDLSSFEASGIDPFSLKGASITVSGLIKMYNGRPEIILTRPSQIEADGGVR